MSNNDWHELSSRTQEVIELVIQISDLATSGEKEADLIYRDYNWGLVPNSMLYSALLEMREKGTLETHEQIMATRSSYTADSSGATGVLEDSDDSFAVKIKPETIITKDLAWFIRNGENEDIRLKATEMRERLLLDLYIEHVQETGETYFPQLQQLLQSVWNFRFKGDDN
jgi:hypothetical protein